MSIVIVPDVELTVTGLLRTALSARAEAYADGVFVGNTVPNPRRDRMVIIRRDGGPRLDVVRELARLGVNVWGATEQEAADLCRLVCALLLDMPDGAPIISAEQSSGPSPIPDVQPRRFASFNLIVRGAAA